MGFDAACGWFGTVRKSGRLLGSVDALEGNRADLSAVLRLLTDHGFFSADDVAEALWLLPHQEWEEITSSGTRLAAQVIEQLKQAAGR
mgnify:CR=1 FL=1